MKKQILETVRGEGGKLYKPGDEEALAKDFDQNALNNLAESGAIVGEWKSFKNEENFLSQEETARRLDAGDESEIVMDSFKYWNRKRREERQAFEENTQKGPAGDSDKSKTDETKGGKAKSEKSKAGKTGSEGLPKDFPGADKLTELGLKTTEEVQKLSLDQLVEIGLDTETAEAVLAFGK